MMKPDKSERRRVEISEPGQDDCWQVHCGNSVNKDGSSPAAANVNLAVSNLLTEFLDWFSHVFGGNPRGVKLSRATDQGSTECFPLSPSK
jgi:hypothetical protein